MTRVAELVLAAGCFAAALACSAGGWRALLPRGVSLVDACARFGCGSLANTFLPARAGDVVRLSLFGRVVPGGMVGVAGAVAAFGVARWLTVLPLGVGAAGSSLPPEAYAGPAVALAVAVVLARRGPHPRSSCRAYAAAGTFAGATLGARLAGVALVGAAIGVPRPFSAALLVVPALEIAGTVSVLPANLGVAEGAAALALHAHGLPMGRALAGGLVLHGVETAAGIVFGGAGAGLLLRRSQLLHRIVTIRPTTLWRAAATLPARMRRKIKPLLCELHARITLRWSRDWRSLRDAVDRW
ncbi:MAG TPA: hypothetical protein VF706_04210, partial [Solirubrobacteraceae bacterium]